MAKYRPIFTKIWDDPDFKEYNTKEKLIFIYLCTNTLTTESGIYAISCKTISEATGIKINDVNKVLLNNTMKNVTYDQTNKVVFVKSFLRYNGRGRKDLVVKSIYNDFKNVKTPLWDEFKRHYLRYYQSLLNLSEVLEKTSIPNPTLNPISNPISNPKSKPNLTPYSNGGENLNIDDEIEEMPIEEMRAIFVKHWKKHNKGYYTPNYRKEEEVARRLYQQCIKDLPEDPLRVFERKVERLYEKNNIKCFSGLEKYWNFAAGEKSVDPFGIP